MNAILAIISIMLFFASMNVGQESIDLSALNFVRILGNITGSVGMGLILIKIGALIARVKSNVLTGNNVAAMVAVTIFGLIFGAYQRQLNTEENKYALSQFADEVEESNAKFQEYLESEEAGVLDVDKLREYANLTLDKVTIREPVKTSMELGRYMRQEDTIYSLELNNFLIENEIINILEFDNTFIEIDYQERINNIESAEKAVIAYVSNYESLLDDVENFIYATPFTTMQKASMITLVSSTIVDEKKENYKLELEFLDLAKQCVTLMKDVNWQIDNDNLIVFAKNTDSQKYSQIMNDIDKIVIRQEQISKNFQETIEQEMSKLRNL
jgi:hypothetical protein